MGINPLRSVWVVFGLALVLLGVFFLRKNVSQGDAGKAFENTKPRIRHGNTNGGGGTKTIRNSVDAGEWRRDALEILGRIEECPEVEEILPEAARLSAIFREWGKADFEKVKQFLETNEVTKKALTPDRLIAEDLILAALIGFAKNDPEKAWTEFLKTQDYSKQPLLLNGVKPYPHEVAAAEIMRDLFRKSEGNALKALRGLDGDFHFLLAPSLNAILTDCTNPKLRLKILEDFSRMTSLSNEDIGMIYAGLAKHDAKAAWDLLKQGVESQSIQLGDDSEFKKVHSFVVCLTTYNPEKGLEFIASLDDDKNQISYAKSWIMSQAKQYPEMIVKILEHHAFEDLQQKVHPEPFTKLVDGPFSWPLLDKHVPLPLGMRYETLRKAVKSSKLPDDLKQRFLASIEAEEKK